MEADHGSSHSPLVSVSFEKNEQRKFKFLEGEPKALGITQVCLSIFHISCIAALFGADLIKTGLEIPSFIFSFLICIAGCLAIAGVNLHLPMLRACMGMEVIAGISSFFNLSFSMIKMMDLRIFCSGSNNPVQPLCRSTEAGHTHLFTELVVIQLALFAISVTLVVYAAKVVNCCSPPPKVPVITVHTPPAPQ